MTELFSLVVPFVRRLPPEWAHRLTIWSLRSGLAAPSPFKNPALECRVAGIDFPNPLGLAAGFDKNAEAVDALWRLGFGFIEVGTLTPRPQPGNPKPRVFRLPEDQAVINRLGFNNHGLAAALDRIAVQPRHGLLGINIGKNGDSQDAIADYRQATRLAAPAADYLTINISSPNTPGLRDLQSPTYLAPLLRAVLDTRATVCQNQPNPPPLFLKISPDLSGPERHTLATTILAEKIDGLIISNTTLARPPGLRSRWASETGGLSGQPLFEPATRALADFYRLTGGKVPLIGVGGVQNGVTAYAKIRAGASLIQLYTGLIYHGPSLIKNILSDLTALLKKDGYQSLHEAVGADSAQSELISEADT